MGGIFTHNANISGHRRPTFTQECSRSSSGVTAAAFSAVNSARWHKTVGAHKKTAV